jgi:hypothetical protein
LESRGAAESVVDDDELWVGVALLLAGVVVELPAPVVLEPEELPQLSFELLVEDDVGAELLVSLLEPE